MTLIVILAVWVASAIPLFTAEVNSGGWLLAGLVFGAVTALMGGSLVAAGGLGCSPTMVTIGAIFVLGGGGLGIYGLVSLLARGAGLHIEVNQT